MGQHLGHKEFLRWLLSVAIRLQAEKHVYAALMLYENTFFFSQIHITGLLRSFMLYRLNLQGSLCESSLCRFFLLIGRITAARLHW